MVCFPSERQVPAAQPQAAIDIPPDYDALITNIQR
jgi:hypothetical protein